MLFGPAQIAQFPATSVTQFVVQTPAIVHGWALIETTGLAAARVDVYDGLTGARIAPISLCAGESARDWFSGGGIFANGGIVVRVPAGSVAGSIWYRGAPGVEHRVELDPAAMLDELVETVWAALR